MQQTSLQQEYRRLPVQQRPHVAQEFVCRFGGVALLLAHPVDDFVDLLQLLHVRGARACRDLDDVLQVAEELLLYRLFQPLVGVDAEGWLTAISSSVMFIRPPPS